MKIDLGCGPNKREGFIGCDQYAFDGKVDKVFNIGDEKWPFEEGEIEEAHASHFVEHLNQKQRCHFVNELYRVMQKGGKCSIIVPHWNSNRAYGDPTHQWPAVSEMWFYYLNKDWRAANAPHTDALHWPDGFNCDFEATWGYGMNQALTNRNAEYQQYALSWFKEAAQDIHATLTRK